MPHTTVLYCQAVECCEHAVDVELRFVGRWWADTSSCPGCRGALSEQPSVEKVSPYADGLSDFERARSRNRGEVADALPRDLPGSVRR